MKPQEMVLFLRLHQFPAGLVPVMAGLAYAYWETGAFNFASALTVFLLTGFTLLGAACLNDYFDHRSGVDLKAENRTLLSGGGGLIQTGGWKAQTVLGLGIAAFAAALFLAVRLTAVGSNWTLTGVYAFGILSAIFYTAPPLSAAYRGWGEVLMAVNFGPTAAELGYASQTGRFSFSLLLVSLAFSALILVVHLLHERLDYTADQAAGKRGWVVLWGPQKSRIFIPLFLIAPYLLLLLLAPLGLVPFGALLPLGTATWGIALAVKIRSAEEGEGIYSVLSRSFALYVVFGLLLGFGLVLDAWM